MSDDPHDLLGRWARNTDPARDPITGDAVRARAASRVAPAAAADRGRRAWVLAAAGALVAVALGAALLARAGGDDVVVQTGPSAGGPGPDAAADSAEGAITVQLEPDVCCFIEGFEVGLRFEATDGEVIASTLWSDFVAASGDDTTDAYYDSVLTQEVPAGPVVVRAEVSIGAGPPPLPPDLEGDLPCSLGVEVGPGETVAVEVVFQEADECLRRLTEPTTTTSQAPTTTLPGTTSVGPIVEAPMTTTSIAALTPGLGYYVDVDLDCLAFELEGTWVLVAGDPRSRQPSGTKEAPSPSTPPPRGPSSVTGPGPRWPRSECSPPVSLRVAPPCPDDRADTLRLVHERVFV